MNGVSGFLPGLWGDVIANLFAASVIAVFGLTLTHVLVPLVRGLIKRTPKLDGTMWRRASTDPDQLHSVLEIRQFGTKILATVNRDEGSRVRTFRYRGQLVGHQFVLTWEDAGSPDQMVGTLLLHLSANLQKLDGYTCYYRLSEGRVVANEVRYDRMS